MAVKSCFRNNSNNSASSFHSMRPPRSPQVADPCCCHSKLGIKMQIASPVSEASQHIGTRLPVNGNFHFSSQQPHTLHPSRGSSAPFFFGSGQGPVYSIASSPSGCYLSCQWWGCLRSFSAI